MLYRDSSAASHLGGDFVVGVESSHGVKLSGGSTGGVVEPVGDDTDISLTLRAKGAGLVSILSGGAYSAGSTATGGANSFGTGSTGQVTIGSSGSTTFFGGSTAPFSGFIRFQDTAVATPNFATTNAMVMETTHAITGMSTAIITGNPYFIIANPVNVSTDCALVGVSVDSSNAGVHCRWLKCSTVTVGASTATVNFLIIRM